MDALGGRLTMNIQSKKKILLASQSPRREELLAKIGVPFEIVTSNVVEHHQIESPSNLNRYAESLAKKKAEAVAAIHPDAVIIGADTIVGKGNQIFHKPKSQEEAKLFLQELSGETHGVITAVAIIDEGEVHVFSEEVQVTFYELEDALIDSYLDTGDYIDKAGGYGIQTEGALLVKEIKGDYYTVMGLPIASLFRHLQALSIIELSQSEVSYDD